MAERLNGTCDESVTVRGEPSALIRGMAALGANAASVFALDAGGRSLRREASLWDRARADLRVAVEHWPNVAAALKTGRPVRITAETARLCELPWFEEFAIKTSVCAPMLGPRGPLGVLFLDYFDESASADFDGVASCAEAVVRAREPVAAAARPCVRELMSRDPVLVDGRVTAHAAERVAAAGRVHHLLAVRDGRLVGVLCRCDLASASPVDPIESFMHGEVVSAAPGDGAEQAARTMRERGVGCLPVLTASGELVGVLTRGDLRRAGVLPGVPGVDVCAACGQPYGLLPAGSPEGLVLCRACLLGPPREHTLDPFYVTGSG